MALHLVKLCVGAETIEDLAAWQRSHRRSGASGKASPFHSTFQTPKRQAELLDGGSLYWVIKGVILVRQRIRGFEEGRKSSGSPCCHILLDRKLMAVRPVPRRAFQGWRYLAGDDAPDDMADGAGGALDRLPPKMRKELAALGLI